MMADSKHDHDSTPLELWAGLECTVNRTQNKYHDQCLKNGHDQRIEDLEAFAALGIKRIRYPFLWEKIAPRSLDELKKDESWARSAERLQKLKELGLKPIAGFLHHGSGPAYTSLVDPEFPEKFAYFAKCFAERFPWVEDYTPINEPLTTARFSGLYGVWYPHGRSDKTFARALCNEIKAIILAMQEIRKINPKARLIQTEDLGRASASKLLQYQAEFENERRWLSYDLLCGRVTANHPLYEYLVKAGVCPLQLKWISDHQTNPDVMGINHYLLSNRFLDHQLSLYPKAFHGGNKRHRYADVGAVDTGRAEPPTPKSIFKEAWKRYHLPIAVTEVHTAGARESQLRWLKEIWQSAVELRKEGVNFSAVAPWSLLGSFDWNSLCTLSNHSYESGIFDVRAKKPRPTAVATMLQSLATKGEFDHPVLDEPGWWVGPQRMRFAPTTLKLEPMKSKRPLLITGATGTLGRAFAKICETRRIPYRLISRNEMDIADPDSVERALHSISPWAVINTAGYVRVDDAEREQDRCFRENVTGPENLARACSKRGLKLVTFSSDMVFDGSSDCGYLESSNVCPVNTYGRSKAEAEKRVLELHPESLVVRTSSFFGPWDEYNFVTQTLRAIASGKPFDAAQDIRISPTYVPDLVNACLDLVIDAESGLIHLTNEGAISWAELASAVASQAIQRATDTRNEETQSRIGNLLTGVPIDPGLVRPAGSEKFGYVARRPKYSVLGTERMNIMPSLEDAIGRYFEELEVPIYR